MKRNIKINREEFCKEWDLAPHTWYIVMMYFNNEAAKEGKVMQIVKGKIPGDDKKWIDEKIIGFWG